MGLITSHNWARKDRITLIFDLLDPVFPGAATPRDPTHQIKLLNNVYLPRKLKLCPDMTKNVNWEVKRKQTNL